MSSTTTPKKPSTPGNITSGPGGRRQPPGAASAASPTPGARGTSPSSSNVLSTNGVARNASLKNTPGTGRPPRAAAARRPGSTAGVNTSAASAEEIAKAEEAKAETAALIESLRKSVHDAEMASEDYQRQVAATQQKIDDLMADHAKLEEQYHESMEKLEELEFEKRESKRHAQEMERIYESERVAMMKDREEAANREREMKSTIQRLKESAAGREVRGSMGGDTRSPRQGRSPTRGSPKIGGHTDEGSPFAPSLPRSDSQGTSRLVMQKDQIIEGLRLELAEAQIKLVEMENAGGDRMQELEKALLETRMTNARLMEDNDSFQLLLGERTISGDFQKTELMQAQQQQHQDGGSTLGSLAEELESAEGESANYRRVEAELRSQKDQNKALTLYIEKIISRVLQHENFETILDQKGGLGAPPGARPSSSRDKDLPPPPPAKDDASAQGESLLQRATSVVRRQRPVSAMFTGGVAGVGGEEHGQQQPSNITRRPRPSSVYVGPTAPERGPTANEDPTTAPSIPLGRAGSVSVRGRAGVSPSRAPTSGASNPPASGHRRNASDRSNDLPGAAGIVSQMYRGPTTGTGTTAPLSPLSPGSGSRSYFSPVKARGVSADASATAGAAASSPPQSSSGLGHRPRDSSESGVSRLSADSAAGGGAPSSDVSSPPRDRAGNTQYTGAVMQQNKLRPLRLVQESGGEDAAAAEAAAARKKANRGSWMGWFNRGKDEAGGPLPAPGSAGAPHLERTDERAED